jgi:hypothetical protein
MKAYGKWIWEVNVKFHIFLTSALAGGEWSASRPGRFTHGEIALDRTLGGPLDDVEKRKFLIYRDWNSDPSVVQPVASRYTECAIQAPTSVSD